MTKKYQEDLHFIIKEDSDMKVSSKINEITESNKSLECHNSIIYENLVVRHT